MLSKIFPMGLDVDTRAPDFCLVDQNSKSHSLKDYEGKWLVLYFYPKDNTPGCTAEACSFRDSIEDLKNLNASVLGVSTDSRESHEKFIKKFSLNFPLLSDEDKELSRKYKVLLPFGISNRITFIIDPEGIIREKVQFVKNAQYGLIVQKKLNKLILYAS